MWCVGSGGGDGCGIVTVVVSVGVVSGVVLFGVSLFVSVSTLSTVPLVLVTYCKLKPPVNHLVLNLNTLKRAKLSSRCC